MIMTLQTRLAALAAATALVAAATPSFGQTVDGTRDAVYGAPLAVQANPTGFGDSNNPVPAGGGGSELDAAYGVVAGGNLNLFLSGNLESNGNKLVLLIDSVAGGQNTLLGNNADVDFNALNRLGGDGTSPGLTFDSGFSADYYVSLNGDGNSLFANYATLPTGGNGTGQFLGFTTYGPGGGTFAGDSSMPNGIMATIDSSNTGGVTGDTADAGAAAAVTTGAEYSIPLSLLGNPTGEIRVLAFVASPDNSFVSNQFLGGVPAGTANFGEPRTINLAQFAGDQFFTVAAVPEPSPSRPRWACWAWAAWSCSAASGKSLVTNRPARATSRAGLFG